jgi:hypothetical protein
MTTAQYLKHVEQLEISEREQGFAKDKETANANRKNAEKYLKLNLPEFYEYIHDSITGAIVMRFDKKTGGGGEGSIGLVVEESYVVYAYRNSAYQQMAITKYLGENATYESDVNKSVSCRQHWDIPISVPAINDAKWREVFKRAMSKIRG